MKKKEKFLCGVFLFLGITQLLQINASAYIDPSTTAMVTQIVAGAVISLGIAFGIFRQRIISFFKGIKVNRLQKKIEKEQKH